MNVLSLALFSLTLTVASPLCAREGTELNGDSETKPVEGGAGVTTAPASGEPSEPPETSPDASDTTGASDTTEPSETTEVGAATHDPNEDWDEEDEQPREPFRPHFETTPSASSRAKPPGGPFDQGKLRLGLGFGGARSDEESWLVLGINAGYFLLDGLEAHVDTSFWLIGQPFLFTPSPGLRYVFVMVPQVKPYLGGFYRRYVVAGSTAGADAVGGRAGVLFMTGLRSHFGGGVIYERILQDHLFSQQNQIYPEILLSLAF